MKIWQKMIVALGGSSLLLGVVGLITIKTDMEIQSQTNQIVDGIVKEAKAAGDMFSTVESIQTLNEKILLSIKNDTPITSDIKKYELEIEADLKSLQQHIIIAQQTNLNQKKSLQELRLLSAQNQSRIEAEIKEINKLNQLQDLVKLYQKDWQNYLSSRNNNPELSQISSEILSQRMSQSIFPLVKQYYQGSLEEIIESELATRKLTQENITIIKQYIAFTFVLSLILFIYLYDAIYPAIRKLKIATHKLGTNFLEYQPIQPRNTNDELANLTRYFNLTISELKNKIVSKSYLDSIINSICQSIIVIDNNQKIQKINANVIELLGYSESELLDQHINLILAPNNDLELNELIKLDNLSDNCFLLRFISKQQQQISTRVYFSDLIDFQGHKKGKIILAFDSDSSDLIFKELTKSKRKIKR
ncbi:MAG: PAS domain S-box protein [Prochloraceae cyanobacterium]